MTEGGVGQQQVQPAWSHRHKAGSSPAPASAEKSAAVRKTNDSTGAGTVQYCPSQAFITARASHRGGSFCSLRSDVAPRRLALPCKPPSQGAEPGPRRRQREEAMKVEQSYCCAGSEAISDA